LKNYTTSIHHEILPTPFAYCGRKPTSNLSKTCDLLDFFVHARFPVNSEVVRPAWKSFAATLWVRKRKLLGIGTGGQEPPNFVQGAESCTYCVFHRKWRPLWSWVSVTEQIFLAHTWDGTAAYQRCILLPRSQFFWAGEWLGKWQKR